MDAFWTGVEVGHPAGCWTWTASKTPGGYGQSRQRGTTTLAHRISYELLVGPIPPGLVLDHLCRNRACVNPDHLEPVTPGENVRRGYSPVGKGMRRNPSPRPVRVTCRSTRNSEIHPSEARTVARLRATRRARGLSQAATSRLAGVPAAAIAAVEAGQRSVRVSEAARLADAYAVSLADLIADGPYSVPMEDVA